MQINWLQKIKYKISPPEFILTIKNSSNINIKGICPKTFVDDCSYIAKENNLNDVDIYGDKEGKEVKLLFSKNVPASIQQRVRNAWHFHKK